MIIRLFLYIFGIWKVLCEVYEMNSTTRRAVFPYFRHRGLEIIPVIGIAREQSGPVPVVRPPHHHKPFPFFRIMLMAKMTDSQVLPLGPIAFTDKKGNPVTAPTGIAVAWSVDNPNLATLTPSADGLSCDVASVGPLGSVVVSVAVTDSTSGSALAGGSVEIDIVSGAPSQVTIPVGSPTEQPDAPPSPPAPAPAQAKP